MTTIVAFIVFPAFFIWHLWFMPKVGASIAADHGEDYKKWHINIILFGFLAVIYMASGIEKTTEAEKNSIKFIIIGSIILYIAFTATAFML